MRGQLTGLWGQPMAGHCPGRTHGGSAGQSGSLEGLQGVTQQGPGATSLPRRGLFMQVYVYRSPSSRPTSGRGYGEETSTASA